MTLGEGAAHRILAGQANGEVLVQQGGEGQALGGGPVQALAAVDGFASAVDDPLQRLVHVDVVGNGRQAVAQVLQLGQGYGGVAARLFLGRLQALPLAVQPVGLVGLPGLAGLELFVEEGFEPGQFGVDLGLGDHALGDQALRIQFAGRSLGANLRIHQRLGEGGVVAFVVAEAAVAEHVHHHVLMELLPVFGGHLGGEDDRLGIVAVDMEDRRLNHQGHIRRIGRTARVARAGGEADLVVDDEMQGAAGAIALQPHQGETFGHHALTREGGVAVDQQRHDLGTVQRPLALGHARVGLADVERLFGARLAQHDRVDDLEVRRIGGQRQVDVVAVELAVGRGAHVVFDVARTLDVARHGRAALELVEDDLVGLAHHGGEHVQAAAVGHAQNDFIDTQIAAALDDLFQRRDHGLAAVQSEPLGAGETLVQEAFEALGLDQLVQDGDLAFLGEGVGLELVRSLEPFLKPGLLLRLGDMHVLDADIAAVGALQDRQHLADRARLQAQHAVEVDRPVQIGAGEAIEFRRKFGVLDRLFNAQRVQVGLKMAAHAIGADQHQGADGIVCGGANGLGRGVGGWRGLGGCGRAGLLGVGLGSRPAAVENSGLLGGIGRHAAAPAAGLGRGGHAGGVVAQLVEEGLPFRRDRAGIARPLLLELLHIGRIGPVQEGGLGKDLVQPTGIVRHGSLVSSLEPSRTHLREGRARHIGPLS